MALHTQTSRFAAVDSAVVTSSHRPCHPISPGVSHRPVSRHSRPSGRAQKQLVRSSESNPSLLSGFDTWEVEQCPDLTGKTFLVTGSTHGLGYETSLWLAQYNAHVVLAGRNQEFLDRVQKDAQAKAGPNTKLDQLKFDLEDYSDVQRAAEEYKSKGWGLNVLVNNAGLFLPPHSITKDGFEVQLQANYYSGWLFTHLLIPLLKQSSEPNSRSRIVWTSSQASVNGEIMWDDLRGATDTESDFNMYAMSKLAQLMVSHELNNRLNSKGIDSIAGHPGIADTNIYANQEGTTKLTANLQQALNPVIGQDQKRGALSIFRAAVDPTLSGKTQDVFIGPMQQSVNLGDATEGREPVNDLAKDDAQCARLYKETKALLEKVTGLSIEEA